jgi:hypothetical protein
MSLKVFLQLVAALVVAYFVVKAIEFVLRILWPLFMAVLFIVFAVIAFYTIRFFHGIDRLFHS